MSVFGKVALGFFVGMLCGLVSLIYGFLTHHRISGIIGFSATTLIGILFSVLDKSPFSSLVVSVLVILFTIANQKRLSNGENEEDEDADNDIT